MYCIQKFDHGDIKGGCKFCLNVASFNENKEK